MCTSSNVHDQKTRSIIAQGAEILRGSLALQALHGDQEVGLGLDVRHSKQGVKAPCYCISRVERRIFWLEGFGYSAYVKQVYKVTGFECALFVFFLLSLSW